MQVNGPLRYRKVLIDSSGLPICCSSMPFRKFGDSWQLRYFYLFREEINPESGSSSEALDDLAACGISFAEPAVGMIVYRSFSDGQNISLAVWKFGPFDL